MLQVTIRHPQSLFFGRGTLISVVLLIFGFRLLAGTPIPLIKEMEAIAIVLMLGYVYFHYVLVRLGSSRPSYSLLELYILAIQFVPLYSAWRAYIVFGQPLLYGTLTQRYIWVSCVALIVLSLLRRGVITLLHLQQALVILAWLSLVMYALLRFMGDPAKYVDEYPAFATYAGGGEYLFKFETVMLAFGLMYHMLNGVMSRSSKHLLLALPFLLFLVVFVDKRSLDLAIVVALFWAIWRYSPPARFLIIALYAMASLAVALVMVNVIYPEFLSALTGRFSDALQVVIKGEEGNDVSSNARIKEFVAALPYLQSQWLLGNGDLSDQWAGGYGGTIGYFFPSDIGLLGGVFVYGVAGVLFLYLQIAFIKRPKLQNRRHDTADVFLVTAYTMIVLLLVQSLIRGGIVFTPGITLVFIVIAYYGSNQPQMHAVPESRTFAVA